MQVSKPLYVLQWHKVNRLGHGEANRIDSNLEPGEIPADMLEDGADEGEETAEG